MRNEDQLVTLTLTVTVEKTEAEDLKQALMDALDCATGIYTTRERPPAKTEVDAWNDAYGDLDDTIN